MLYHYKGVSDTGHEVEGSLQAQDPGSLAINLRRQGVRAYEVAEYALYRRRECKRTVMVVLGAAICAVSVAIWLAGLRWPVQ